MRVFVAYHEKEEFHKNNHHNWQTLFLLCAAHALGDEELFNRALEHYRNGLRVQIARSGALRLELKRAEKSSTYTLMALEAMVQAVYIAEAHGHGELLGLRSKDGGDLKAAVDFFRDLLKNPETWRPLTGVKNLKYPGDPSDWGYIFELPYKCRKEAPAMGLSIGIITYVDLWHIVKQ